MTEGRRFDVSPGVGAAVLLAVLFVGAGGMYFLMHEGRVPVSASIPAGASSATRADVAQPPAAPSSTALQSSPATSPDVVVTLTKDEIARAGIGLAQVSVLARTETLRLPGVVEPNAYRQVSVTPLVGGRLIRVSAQIGDRVRKGQSIAQVYSSELAEARTKYVSAKAMLEAHERELQRTQKLVEIGAASRQELERIHAEHTAQIAEVESTRSRLQLLGAEGDANSTSKADESAINVPSPIDGVVTERLANVGLNVDPTTKLFTIVDLSNVWIVADVYERDLHRVREGAHATITIGAYPDRPLEGRVSFIDPQLNTSTRTAKVRVEAENPRGDLRLGMYTDVAIESASATAVLAVAKDAVQSVGVREVVYLVASSNDPVKFVEREVRLGRVLGDQVEVLAGLSSGDSVASKGSFFVRAEAERLGIRGAQPSPSPGAQR